MKKIISCILFFLSFSTGLTQQKDIAITIYNNNIGLVKEQRQIEIQEGISTISFTDVAAKIDPTSVSLKSITEGKEMIVYEQNFEYDVVNSDKLYNKYIDNTISLITESGKILKGLLMNSSGRDIILQEKTGAIKIINKGKISQVEFPSLPEGLITKPTLIWSVASSEGGSHLIEVRYLTGAINWHAEYVMVSNYDDTAAEISSWVSIDNRSGADYVNARVKVVAGAVAKVPGRRRRGMEMAAVKLAPPKFREKPFFEYHLYELDKPTTIKNNQIKQISLFEPVTVPITKTYEYRAGIDRSGVAVSLEFSNRKEDGLGIPLPMGKLRIYKKDEDGALELVGEDLIDHTPEGKKVSVIAGKAFDITGERKMLNYRKLGDNVREESYLITIENRKEEPVKVKILEDMKGDWKIKRSSHPYEKSEAFLIEFNVDVPAKDKVEVKYTVQYKF